jgi:hypothetical protein
MASGMSLEASVQPIVCALSTTVIVSVYATRLAARPIKKNGNRYYTGLKRFQVYETLKWDK